MKGTPVPHCLYVCPLHSTGFRTAFKVGGGGSGVGGGGGGGGKQEPVIL